ncbi:hypothetical protein WR25_26307 [Diploscapter pachys]|uniref:Uncharacterized protein n=1 Tax=Diploscapter pachys TaxID=2018661 RepID=A0A2A2JQ70_9BILA|nr:hypothetical protein WR25_26307 [Diploscapter pachys]
MLPASHQQRRSIVFSMLNEWNELHRCAVESFASIPEPERLGLVGFHNAEMFRRQVAQCENWKTIKHTMIELALCLYDLSRCQHLRVDDVNRLADFADKALQSLEVEERMDHLKHLSRQLGASCPADAYSIRYIYSHWELYNNSSNAMVTSTNYYVLRNALYKLCAFNEDNIRFFNEQLRIFVQDLYDFMDLLTMNWMEAQAEDNMLSALRNAQCRQG